MPLLCGEASRETLDQRSDESDQKGDDAADHHFHGAIDGGFETGRAWSFEDARSHDNCDGDGRDAPTAGRFDELRADENGDADAEKNGQKIRAEEIEQGKGNGATDESVYDPGVEGQKRGAELRFGHDDDGNDRPEQLAMTPAVKNEPEKRASGHDAEHVLPTGRLRLRGLGWSGLSCRGHV